MPSATSWSAGSGVPAPRRPCARLVHLRAAERQPADVRRDGQLAEQADLTFAQFVMLTPFPGTVDFAAWEKTIDPADKHRRGADHPPLADPAGLAARRSTPRIR